MTSPTNVMNLMTPINSAALSNPVLPATSANSATSGYEDDQDIACKSHHTLPH